MLRVAFDPQWVRSALGLGVADTVAPGTDHAGARNRRARVTSGALVGSRVTRALVTLVTVPLTIGYLGTERYGLWMAMNSLVAVFAFADLGLGNGLLNAVSEAHGRNDRRDAARHVSSAFFMLAGVAVLLGLLFAAAYPFLDWTAVFGLVSPEAQREAAPAIAVLVGCFLLALPLGVAQRAQLGYQEGYVTAAWEMVGNVASLAAVLLVIRVEGGLPWLVLAVAGVPLLAMVTNAAVLWTRRRPWLRPSWAHARAANAAALLRVGLLFFTLQLVMAAAFFADSFIIARFLGAGSVASYAVPWKMFEMIGTATMLLLVPLWPAYGESIARGDAAWVRSTLIRSLWVAAGVSAAPAIAAVVLGPWIVRLWSGGAVGASVVLLSGMAALAVMQAVGNAVVMFLNAANRLRVQILCAVAMGSTALALKVLLIQRFGIVGVVWATAFAYFVFSAVPLLVYSLREVERCASA